VNQRPILLILGNQLFPTSFLEQTGVKQVVMIEDRFLCEHFVYHQQKLVLVLAAMRAYAQQLQEQGFELTYIPLDENATAPSAEDFLKTVEGVVSSLSATELVRFEVEGKVMERRLVALTGELGIAERVLPSPMFLCSRQEFASFLQGKKKPQMAGFYKLQRTRLNLLMEADGSPVGGRWSFDEDNRKKLPKDVQPPPLLLADVHPVVEEVQQLVQQQFAHHPGSVQDFWWPVTRQGAMAWFEDFLQQRLAQFGPFEDAISQRSRTVFHSALSPLMNLGLITPLEIVQRTVAFAEQNNVPMQSLEGFVRQVIGWREFVRGIHQNYGAKQRDTNFWKHQGKLTDAWYSGQTGIEPLDAAIIEARDFGWSHHIPRLMVVANLMTLCEITPRDAHRWFMEMYVDSSSWVMGPNVYGMGVFSDGGIFATKPYICGSNYLLKMSDYKKGPWCDVVDGLYWRFIANNREFFASNPRLALMPRALDRLKPERREHIFDAAESFLSIHTG
jgi:deoxyribodipyrimidine photolyase-related protein